jgi:hypothetical protein
MPRHLGEVFTFDLTCTNTAKFRIHLQVKRGQPTRRETPYAIARDVSAETPGTPAPVLARDSCAAAQVQT